jgi:tetratricopeptide (TPR) repeat protein
MRLHRLVLIFMAFYLTFLGGSSYYAVAFPVRVAHHALMTALMAWWLWSRWRKGGVPHTPLNPFIFAMMGVWAMSAFFALVPRMAFESLWFGVLHVVLFFMLVEQFQRGRQRTVMDAVFIMAVLVVMLSVLEFASWYFGLGILPGTSVGWVETGVLLPSLAQIPNASLAMSVSTLVAGYVAPLVIVAIVWASTTNNRGYRVVLGGLALALLGVLVLTSSRGGGVNLMVAGSAFALIQLARSSWVTRHMSPRAVAGIGALVVGVGLMAFVIITFPQGNQGVSNAGRLDMWQSAVRIATDHPILGVGYGMFGRAFRDYRDPTIAQDKLASAHNLYLNTLAETGVIGACVALLIGIALARALWHTWRTAPDLAKRKRLEGTACALLGMGAHSFVDTFTITPIVLLALVWVAYGITPLPTSQLAPRPQGQRLPALILLVVVLGYGVWLALLDRAQGIYMASFSASSAQEALTLTREAQAQDPHLTLYSLHEAFILGITDDPSALSAFERAVTLEPTWDIGWMWLAYLYETQGDFTRALEAIERAYALHTRNGSAVHWARLAEATQKGERERILDAYALGIRDDLENYRALPITPFWRETPLRAEALERFLSDMEEAQRPDVQYRILSAHDPARASAFAIALTPNTASTWWVRGEHALTAGNDPARALEAFSQAIAIAPTGDAYASRARAYLALNDIANAERDLRLARAYGTVFESPDSIADDKPPQLTARLAFAQETGAVLYQRPVAFRLPPAYIIPNTP